mgnify:CR=1 FL=1
MSERKMPSVEDFPSNAIGQKEKENLPVVKARHKKSVWKSIGDRFISEDAEYVGSSLLEDILFPALNDLINDILHGAVDMTFGGGGSYNRNRRRNSGSYISYNRMYDDRPKRRRSRYDDEDDYDRRSSRRRLPDCSEYIFDPRDFDRPSDAKRAADDLLEMMADRIQDYGEVTVAWFFDRVGEDSGWNAEDWGWTNLAGVKVRGNSRNGWYIDLPRPKELT